MENASCSQLLLATFFVRHDDAAHHTPVFSQHTSPIIRLLSPGLLYMLTLQTCQRVYKDLAATTPWTWISCGRCCGRRQHRLLRPTTVTLSASECDDTVSILRALRAHHVEVALFKNNKNCGMCMVPSLPNSFIPCHVLSDTHDARRTIEAVVRIYSRLLKRCDLATHASLPIPEVVTFVARQGRSRPRLVLQRRILGPSFGTPSGFQTYPDYFRVLCGILALQRLTQLHELGFRHNNIHPEAVLLDYHSNHAPDVRLTSLDYLSESLLLHHSQKQPCVRGGTQHNLYASPELLLEHTISDPQEREFRFPVTRASDLWSLGLVLLDVFSGRSLKDLGTPPLCRVRTTTGASWKIPPDVWRNNLQTTYSRQNLFKTSLLAYAAQVVFQTLVQPDLHLRDGQAAMEGLFRLLLHGTPVDVQHRRQTQDWFYLVLLSLVAGSLCRRTAAA